MLLEINTEGRQEIKVQITDEMDLFYFSIYEMVPSLWLVGNKDVPPCFVFCWRNEDEEDTSSYLIP